MNNLKVLCDVDGVLCNFINGVLDVVNDKNIIFGDSVWIEDEIKKDFRKYPFYGQWLEDAIHEEGFCENLPLINGAKEFISYIRNDLNQEILFVTSPYPSRTWCYERIQFLKKNFDAKREDVIFCRDKRFIMGKTLIDDHEINCVDWSDQNKKESIIMSRPYNLEADLKSKINPDYHFGSYVNRCKDFEEIKNILKILVRK